MIGGMYISALCFVRLALVASSETLDLESGEDLDVSMVMPTAVRPARDLGTLLLVYAFFLMFKLLRELFRAEHHLV